MRKNDTTVKHSETRLLPHNALQTTHIIFLWEIGELIG